MLLFPLGMRIIPSRDVSGHTDKRIFRLRSALRVLMHRRRVSGRVVQLIAGHLSFSAIASRGALSLFGLGVLNSLEARDVMWNSVGLFEV